MVLLHHLLYMFHTPALCIIIYYYSDMNTTNKCNTLNVRILNKVTLYIVMDMDSVNDRLADLCT